MTVSHRRHRAQLRSLTFPMEPEVAQAVSNSRVIAADRRISSAVIIPSFLLQTPLGVGKQYLCH